MANLYNKAGLVNIPIGYSDGFLYNIKPVDDTLAFRFNRDSSATRVNEQGLIETIAIDKPRIDYTDSLTSPSFLLEPQSSNTATYSNDFTQGIIFNTSSIPTPINAVVTSNQAISPNGANDAWLFKDDNSGNFDTVSLNYNSLSVNSNDNNIVSIFVKKALSNNFFSVTAAGFDVSANGISYFNIKDGTLGTIDPNHIGKIEDYGNGWYRCSVIFKTTTDTTGRVRFRVATEDDNINVTSDGTNGVYLFGLQCEASATQNYVTSYIPTQGSVVTRSAETCSGAGNSTVFNDSEGVLYAEIAALADDLTLRTISINDSSNNNEVRITYRNLSNQLNFHIRENGVSVIFRSFTVSDITEFAKVAFKYKSGESSVFIDGTEVLSMNETFTFTDTLDQLSFETGATADDFYGKTKGVYVFNETLTDDELQQLTS